MRWVALAVAVVLVAGTRSYFSGGAVGQAVDRWREARLERTVTALLAQLPPPGPTAGNHPTSAPAASPGAAGTGDVAAAPDLPAFEPVARRDGVELLGAPFHAAPQAPPGSSPLRRIEGAELGFDPPPAVRPYLSMEQGAMHLGALAAGDVENDGWPDVAVGTHAGVRLYANVGGRFTRRPIDFPAAHDWMIGDVALVDLDGDAALDLFFSTWMQGSHVLLNRGGRFSEAAHIHLPRGRETAVHATAFADVDRDGDLDIVTGATTHVPRFFSPDAAVNHLWRNDGTGAFTPEPLEGPNGETLTLLFHDVDGDDWPDLFVGNDFDEPDRLYRNDRGTLRPVTGPQNPIPVSTYDTMSADAGDVDNDGRDELYIGGIGSGDANAAQRQRTALPLPACEVYGTGAERERCDALAAFQIGVYSGYATQTVAGCRGLDDPTARRDCLVSAYHWNGVLARLPLRGADKDRILAECTKVPADFATLHDICAVMADSRMDGERSYEELPEEQPQVKQTNLLYTPTDDGYRDVTADWRAGLPGWTWNARFGDLDNDGWQDLFVAEGTRLRPRARSASFFHNQRGRGFREVAAPAGLEDFNPTGASLLLDYDVDGDLDVITHPFLLTPVVWRNDAPAGDGLEVRLEDATSSNPHGIGARVTIRSADGRQQVRVIKGSGGYQSHDAPVARFGLGGWRAVAAVEVRWPDGSATTLDGLDLGAGRHVVRRVPAAAP